MNHFNQQQKSCAVALPRECNNATFAENNATAIATIAQPSSLKARADAVLKRNKQCNSSATVQKIERNFSGKNEPQKLHGENETKISELRALVYKLYSFFGEPKETLSESIDTVIRGIGIRYTLDEALICFKDVINIEIRR